jgi:tRNA(Ile)-lysidine synthase
MKPGQQPAGGSGDSASGSARPIDAAAVRAAFPLERLIPEVVHTLAEAERPKEPAWILACSGGADSVASTLLAWAHFPELRGRMLVAHLNHGLRGISSEGDAAFTQQLAGGLGLAFHGELLTWASQ